MTLEVLKLEISKLCNELHPENIFLKLVTKEVLKFEEKIIFFKELHPLNIYLIDFAFFVSKLDKSNFINLEQPENKPSKILI